MLEKLLFGKLEVEEMVTIKALGSDYKSASNPLAIYSKYLHEIGQEAKPGDRLPFILKMKPGGKKAGDFYEDPDIFIRDKCEYNRMMYLESQFANKFDKLLHVAYPEMIPDNMISQIIAILGVRPKAAIGDCIFGIMSKHVENLAKLSKLSK
jgi:hypothetical protein